MGVSTSAIFAKIAIEKGLLDEKKLEKARTLQRLARKDGKNVPLDRACLDLDLLTQAQVKGLERGIRYYVVRKADKIYGNFAVKKKFCDEETVTHCLEKQKTEFTKKKRLVRLSKLLQGLDALTSAQDAEARAYVAKRLTPEESHHEQKAVSEPEARAAVAKRAATKASGERKAPSGDSGRSKPAAAKKPTGGARKAYVPSEDEEEEAPKAKGRISKAELKALAASSDDSLKLDSPNPLPLEEKPSKAAKSASQDETRAATTSRSKRASVERPAAKLDSAEDTEAKAVVATKSGRARKDVTVSKSAIAVAAAEPAAEARARPVSASEDALPEVPEAPKPHASADEHPGAGEAAKSPAASAPEADVVVAIAGTAKAEPAATTGVTSAAPAAGDPPGDDGSAQVLAAIEKEAPITAEASGDATSSGGDTKGDDAGAQAGEPVKLDDDEEMILDLSETAAPGKKRVDFSDSEDL